MKVVNGQGLFVWDYYSYICWPLFCKLLEEKLQLWLENNTKGTYDTVPILSFQYVYYILQVKILHLWQHTVTYIYMNATQLVLFFSSYMCVDINEKKIIKHIEIEIVG